MKRFIDSELAITGAAFTTAFTATLGAAAAIGLVSLLPVAGRLPAAVTRAVAPDSDYCASRYCARDLQTRVQDFLITMNGGF